MSSMGLTGVGDHCVDGNGGSAGWTLEARVLQEKSELHLSDNFYDNVFTNGELESNQYTSCVICLLLVGSYGSCI